MAEQFYTLVTDIGLAKITNGLINEEKVDFTHMAVGDGGGGYYNPSSSQTNLVREVWRGPIGVVDVDEEDNNRIQIVAPIPSAVGGFFIREVGLYDADGDLIVIAKHPETYKPVIDNGSIKDLSIKLLIEVANSSSIVMKIDPTIITATRKYVDDKVAGAVDTIGTELTELQEEVTERLDNLDDLIGLEPAEKPLTINPGLNTIDAPVKSPVHVKRIDGRTIVNHIPLFDSGAWTLLASSVVKAPDELELNISGAAQNNSVTLGVTPGAQYTLNGDLSDSRLAFTIWDDAQAVPIKLTGDAIPFTFTVPANVNRISVYIGTGNAPNGKYTAKNITLNKGAQAQPFVANVKGVTNPTITNESNGTSLVVPTTLYDGEYVERNAKGELVKHKKWQEKIIDDKYAYQVFTYPGNKRVLLPGMGTSNLTITKYNGTVLQIAPFTSSMPSDTHSVNVANLYITIANTDSGWGPDYTPTPDEIKAYFLGWYMYTDSPAYAPYNNTGNKVWVYRNKNFEGSYVSGALSGGIYTLPTTQAPINSKWQPYRLIYELDEPVQEIIHPYGDLVLDKGDNDLQVYAGRNVNELNKPYVSSTSATVAYLNYSDFNPLRHKLGSTLNLFENSKATAWDLSDSINSNGTSRIIISMSEYNPTASYTVDYEPLYPWQVTTPIDVVEIDYYESLQAVTNTIVADIAAQRDAITRMLDNVVNEDEGVQWFTPTLLNGWAQFTGNQAYNVGFCKDKAGNVTFSGAIKDGVIGSVPVFRLPKGFRPAIAEQRFIVSSTNASSAYNSTHINVTTDGYVQVLSGYNAMVWLSEISFKAEQ